MKLQKSVCVFFLISGIFPGKSANYYFYLSSVQVLSRVIRAISRAGWPRECRPSTRSTWQPSRYSVSQILCPKESHFGIWTGISGSVLDSLFGQIRIHTRCHGKRRGFPGLCTSNEGWYLKYYWINILDNFESLTEDVWQQKIWKQNEFISIENSLLPLNKQEAAGGEFVPLVVIIWLG